MQIVFTQSFGSHQVGEVMELPDPVAQNFIHLGVGEAVTGKKPATRHKTATLSKPAPANLTVEK